MKRETNRQIQDAMIAALPSDTSSHGSMPDRGYVYVPPSHVRALRLDCNLVIGARGVGKTFWSVALRSETIRKMLGAFTPELTAIEVRTGYGESLDPNSYPDADIFESLLDSGVEAYHIWRSVIGRWLGNITHEAIPNSSWRETVEWVKGDPESFSRLLERANAKLDARDMHGLIVFDALDRSSRRWTTMDSIVRDLLRVVLSLRPLQRLHGKVFLREDQFAHRQVKDFPDASKLLATRVELTWAPQELHGLLWQHLCNAPNEHGKVLRSIYHRTVEARLEKIKTDEDTIWTLPDRAKRDEAIQRALFETLAGEWMGRDRRRGRPYTWSVGHLADGQGRTSPRSFLWAILAAAEDSLRRYSDHRYALHYESIKRGVQAASRIRKWELNEDYPWVETLMNPLSGLTVPCSFETIEERWCSALGEAPAEVEFKQLPPEHYEQGWEGVRRDLEALGIFESMKDGRVNMPDLYRVGFGLGRRGGVKPISKASQE